MNADRLAAAARNAAGALRRFAVRAQPVLAAVAAAAARGAGRLAQSLRARAGVLASRAATRAAAEIGARRTRGSRPPKAARAAWVALLEGMGRPRVEDLMERTETPDSRPDEPVTVIDAGLVHGAHRFPSRGFVTDWLYGDAPQDAGPWRVLVVVALGFAAAAAALLWLVMR